MYITEKILFRTVDTKQDVGRQTEIDLSRNYFYCAQFIFFSR